MRYLQLLIDQARRSTDNTDFSDSSGIQTEEFIQYMNDAQSRMQSVIVQNNPDMFQKEKIIAAVRGQEAYDLPSDTLIGNRVDNVEYSTDGKEQNFQKLKQAQISERLTGIDSVPVVYIRRSGQILLQPQPDDLNGLIRLTYTKKLPRLDVRNGSVGTVVLDNNANTITSLILDTTVAIDSQSLLEEPKLTVVDKFGVQKMRDILFTDVQEGSGVITIDPSFVFEEGETIDVGDFVVRTGDGGTHSELPDMTERYLLEYTRLKILDRDSSNDVTSQSPLLQSIEAELNELFSEVDSDPDFITILDDQFLSAGRSRRQNSG